jgi:ZIP family zinc transporter
MLADTMMPEAFQNGGPLVALATAVGFACAFLLSHLAG